MANTYTLIEAKTLTTTTASITFTSIPQTYTDLKCVLSTRSNASQNDTSLDINFNGSASSFSAKFMYGDGSSTASASGSTLILQSNANNSTSSTFANIEIYIPNYTTSNYKSYSNDGVTENNGSNTLGGLLAGLWSNTAAITSITFAPQSGSFMQYSTFYLYGISNS